MSKIPTSALEPSPDSPQKAYLRRQHLKTLGFQRDQLGRDLVYFGLPSGRMLDVALWRKLLQRIFAVERSQDTATEMLRTAGELGIRDKVVLFETSLVEVTRLLAIENENLKASLSDLPPVVQDNFQQARRTGFDVINVDLCGGFLYGSNDNVMSLKHLIQHQARTNTDFLLLTTLEERDTGGNDYDSFIEQTLNDVAQSQIDLTDIRKYYTSSKIKDHPLHLRRMRFCVPTFLLKSSNDFFRIYSRGAWTYKNFYHTALFFQSRKNRNALGAGWPPIDDLRILLSEPVYRLSLTEDLRILTDKLEAPSLPEIPSQYLKQL